ncbi:MAG: copper transporter [Actinomycetota bacterium]
MIDFRYHIVSIVAVFLALGLGVLVGTTVLDRVTVDALEGRLDDLQGRIDQHRRTISELDEERDSANDLIGQLAPKVADNVLAGMQILFVTGEETAGWHARVREAITEAGGLDAGSVTLTSRWELSEAQDRDALIRAFGERLLSERDPAGDGALQLGELLVGGGGDGVLEGLTEAGFVRQAQADEAASFPPTSAHIVVLASRGREPLAAVARGAVRVTSALAVAPAVEQLGAVAALRRIEDPPPRLATFDAAADDPSGVGTVLALRAAADSAGGHFGRGPGLRYIPAP